jgi:hypothetical protein
MDTPWKTDGCLGPLDDGFGAAFGGFGADDDGGGPDSLLTRTFSGSLRGGGGMPHTSLGSIPVGQASVPSSFSGASMLDSGGSSGGGGGGALSLEPALLSGSSLPSLDSGPSAGPPGVSPSPRLASAEDASLARQLVARIEAQQPLAPMLVTDTARTRRRRRQQQQQQPPHPALSPAPPHVTCQLAASD